CRYSRSIGPETETAATTFPEVDRTQDDTEAIPDSRSATLCAHPRRRTLASVAAEKAAFSSPLFIRSGSSQASRTCAAEPAFIVNWLPTGTVSRSPVGRSAAATHTR